MDSHNIYKSGNYKPVALTSVHLVHKNGKHRIVRLGFCWTGFFLPTVWAMSEGLWRLCAISLIGVPATQISQALVSYCDHFGFDAAIRYAYLLGLVGTIGYIFTMVYFGLQGQKLLVDDLLRHGYTVEGSAQSVEI